MIRRLLGVISALSTNALVVTATGGLFVAIIGSRYEEALERHREHAAYVEAKRSRELDAYTQFVSYFDRSLHLLTMLNYAQAHLHAASKSNAAAAMEWQSKWVKEYVDHPTSQGLLLQIRSVFHDNAVLSAADVLERELAIFGSSAHKDHPVDSDVSSNWNRLNASEQVIAKAMSAEIDSNLAP